MLIRIFFFPFRVLRALCHYRNVNLNSQDPCPGQQKCIVFGQLCGGTWDQNGIAVTFGCFRLLVWITVHPHPVCCVNAFCSKSHLPKFHSLGPQIQGLKITTGLLHREAHTVWGFAGAVHSTSSVWNAAGVGCGRITIDNYRGNHCWAGEAPEDFPGDHQRFQQCLESNCKVTVKLQATQNWCK